MTRKLGGWLFVVALVALGLWAYWPSFDQLPRKDQVYVHAEFCRTHSLAEMLRVAWSYNRVRTVMPSDSPLFRPGTFLLLAIQKYAFDHRFELWKIVSLLLHASCCLAMYGLLRTIARTNAPPTPPPPTAAALASSLPLLATGFFALNAVLSDTVSWEHIQGYIVFTALILAALGVCTRADAAEAPPGFKDALLVAVILLPACFFHEVGVVLAPLFAAFFVFRAGGGWRGRGLRRRLALGALLLLPPAIYLATSLADYAAHAPQLVREEQIARIPDRIEPLTFSASLTRILAFCTAQPLLPPAFLVHPVGGRVYPGEILNPRLDVPFALRAGILLATAGFAGLAGALAFRGARNGRWLPALLAASLLSYLGVYSLLRVGIRGEMHPNFLGLNAQYAYLGFALTMPIVLLGILCAIACLPRRAMLLAALAAGYFAAMTVVSALQTRTFNALLARDDAPARKLVVEPARAGLRAAAERGFRRIAFSWDWPIVPMTAHAYGIPLHTIYFGRLESEDPEALIRLPSGKLETDPDRLAAHRDRPRYCASLPREVIEAAAGGRIREYHASYVLYTDGEGWFAFLNSYAPAERRTILRYPFTATGATEEEVRRAAAAQSLLAAEAFRSGKLRILPDGLLHEFGSHAGHALLNYNGRFLAVPDGWHPRKAGPLVRNQLSGVIDADSPEELIRKLER